LTRGLECWRHGEQLGLLHIKELHASCPTAKANLCKRWRAAVSALVWLPRRAKRS